MPSTTRGSILISTANDIGTTLVDKLGGTGYTPDEWDSAANLCGIASADIETALENITESTPQGAERGSMSIAKANSIGSVLNKKFNTSRGFKPSEWASAISKLTPLEIKTASGAIASFSDGADDVPVKSCVVSFLPSGGGGTPSAPVAITGVSGLSVTRTGKNIRDIVFADYSATNILSNAFSLKAGTYTLSLVYNGTPTWCIYIRDGATITSTAIFTKYNDTKITFTLTEDKEALCVSMYYANGITASEVSDVQLEVGSTATTYSPYVTPSVITDTFGQTIYGGSRDLTTDKASVTYTKTTFTGDNSEAWYHDYTGGYHRFWLILADAEVPTSTRGEVLCNRGQYGTQAGGVGLTFRYRYSATVCRLYYYPEQTLETVEDFRLWLASNNLEFAYPLATPTEITGLTPHEIDTLLGDNNFYADTGDTSVEYRADIDLALNP